MAVSAIQFDNKIDAANEKQQRIKDQVNQVLESCSPLEAKLLRLYYLEGFNLEEVAVQLDVHPNTVHAWKKKLLSEIQKNF